MLSSCTKQCFTAGGSFTGAVLNRLFQSALSVGGRVRSETAISTGAASVASVAVELAQKIFGNLDGKRVLVLGAGEASDSRPMTVATEAEAASGDRQPSRVPRDGRQTPTTRGTSSSAQAEVKRLVSRVR